MTVTTDRGHTFVLSEKAVEALKAAKHAGQANAAFEDYADYVPKSDRLDVWVKVS